MPVEKGKGKLHSKVLLKKNDTTLTVYQGKSNKNVLILSTVHPYVKIEAGVKMKTDTVTFYNSSKHGVDVVDQMPRKYSVKTPSRH